VGFATWIEIAGTLELEDLFVDPGNMRRGIAAALINRIVDVLRARGVERLEVTANPHALGFYRAVGFIDCGVAETEFGAAPRMELAISLLRRHHQVSMPQRGQPDASPDQRQESASCGPVASAASAR